MHPLSSLPLDPPPAEASRFSPVRACVRVCVRNGVLTEVCCRLLHRDAEKRNHFSFMNESFSMQCNLTKFSTLSLLLMNIIVDVTYLISGIFTNFHRLLCKKRDVGRYVINHGVMKLMIIG